MGEGWPPHKLDCYKVCETVRPTKEVDLGVLEDAESENTSRQ